MNHRILAFETLPSTSDYLKENLSSLEDGVVVTAISQNKGRGRRGRSWEASRGDLIFSLLLKDVSSSALLSILPLISGVALSSALEIHEVRPLIKWPNDLYLEGKKIAGILCEGIAEGEQQSAIVGIGITLASRSFPLEIASKAESLGNLGYQISKEELLQEFLERFDSLLQSALSGQADWFPLLESRDYLKNRQVHLNYYGENLCGIARGIASNGALLVETDGQIKQVTSGEAILSPDSNNNKEKELTHA